MMAAETLTLLQKETAGGEHPWCISQYDFTQGEWSSLVHLNSWLSGSWFKAFDHVCLIDAEKMVISVITFWY